MADSDNTTSLPFVIHQDDERKILATSDENVRADPTVALSRAWHEAFVEFLDLCKRQQQLEYLVLNSNTSHHLPKRPRSTTIKLPPEASAEYVAARNAEEQAARAADVLLRKVFDTPATSMSGVIAKLEVLLLESEVGDGPSDFPWPHLRSAVSDLRRQVAEQS